MEPTIEEIENQKIERLCRVRVIYSDNSPSLSDEEGVVVDICEVWNGPIKVKLNGIPRAFHFHREELLVISRPKEKGLDAR